VFDFFDGHNFETIKKYGGACMKRPPTPHPGLLPQGEGTAAGPSLKIRYASKQLSVSAMPLSWERFPLSPRERAGVRGNKTPPTIMANQ
jgi:hypothetical protein